MIEERDALLAIEQEVRAFQVEIRRRVPDGHAYSAFAMSFAGLVERLAQQRLAMIASDDNELVVIFRRVRPSEAVSTAPADIAGGRVALCAVLELGAAFYATITSRAGSQLPPFPQALADGVYQVLVLDAADMLAQLQRGSARRLAAMEVGHG